MEPSYSSRLQNVNNQYYSNLPSANTVISNSSLPVGSCLTRSNVSRSNNTYSNIHSDGNLQYSNVWPDDGSRFREMTQESNFASANPRSNMGDSNLSLSSNLVPKAYTKPDQTVTYSNIQVRQPRNHDGLIYSNLMHPPRDGNVYSNIVGAGNDVYGNGGYFLMLPV